MGDAGINTEASTRVQPINKHRVVKGIQATVAAALMTSAVVSCAPPEVVAQKPKTDPDKVLSVPPPTYAATLVPIETPAAVPTQTPETPQNNLVTKVAEERAENNAKILKNDLGLEKNEHGQNYEVLPGGIILVTGGEYGFNDKEQVEAIKLAVAEWNKVDPEVINKLAGLGLKAIAANIAGYGPGGFWQDKQGWSFSYKVKRGADGEVIGVKLVNPEGKIDQAEDAKINYMFALVEETYGIYYTQFLIPNPQALTDKLVWIEKALPEDPKGEETINLLQSWLKENEVELRVPYTTPYVDPNIPPKIDPLFFSIKKAVESNPNKLIERIRILKALSGLSLWDKYYKEVKLSPAIYEKFKGIFFESFHQALRDEVKEAEQRSRQKS